MRQRCGRFTLGQLNDKYHIIFFNNTVFNAAVLCTTSVLHFDLFPQKKQRKKKLSFWWLQQAHPEGNAALIQWEGQGKTEVLGANWFITNLTWTVQGDTSETRSLQQQQHNCCPLVCRLVACKKLLIRTRAPVTVHFLPYTLLTFKKSRIPPHTSAHKHGTRKDMSVSCKEAEHHAQHDVIVVHEKCGSPHCSHKVEIWTKKAATEFETIISYKSPTVRRQSVTGNSTKQNPSWEADWFSASQGILWISVTHLQAPTTCPHPEPDQSSPCLPITLKIHFNIILKFMARCSKWFLSLIPLHQSPYAPLLSPVRAVWIVHFIHHLITQIFGEYIPQSSSLWMKSFSLPWLPLIPSDVNATAPCLKHWLSSGRFILINHKKCHTYCIPATFITRNILPTYLTFDPAVKKKTYFEMLLMSYRFLQIWGRLLM